MKSLFLSMLILLFVSNAFAFGQFIFPETEIKKIRLVKTYPDRDAALLRNELNGAEAYVGLGDYIGLEKYEVDEITAYKIIIWTGKGLTSLKIVRPMPKAKGWGVQF